MVNITIDFKNNKIYLSKPRLIKGGEYTLTTNKTHPGTVVIDNEVKKLLLNGIIALSEKTDILYGQNEYIKYDYDNAEQKGFLKLIKNNEEIIHLSIFTGKKSTPHLTFYNNRNQKIHIFIANLFLDDLNHKNYNDFKDLKSICELFYDLLQLIQNNLHFISTNDKLTDYQMQLSRYITFFMAILKNPSATKLQDGVVYNRNAKKTRLFDDATFKQIINKEIIAKIKTITDFSNQKASIFDGLINDEIHNFIKNKNLTDISSAISEYTKHRCYPITDKAYQFPKYDIFQNHASIDKFIAEFAEIQKNVTSVELAKTSQSSEDTTLQISKDTSDKYNKIVAYITSLNVIFHPNTNKMLGMISNIESTYNELTKKEIDSLKKFIKACSTKSPILYNAILKVSKIDLLQIDITTTGGKPKKPLKAKPLKAKPLKAKPLKAKPAITIKK